MENLYYSDIIYLVSFLITLIAQIFVSSSYSRYKKILKERNTALSQSEYDRDVLAVLTKELIKCDFIIAKQRFGLVERLNTLVDEIFREIEPNKKLELKYVSTLPNITDSKTFMEQVEIKI